MLKTLLLCGLLALSQAAFSQRVSKFPENVGDIAFDSTRDDPAFVVCNPAFVLQYYNTGSYYREHKDSIRNFILTRYRPPLADSSQSGYSTIKFMINCNGQTGRYRLQELDSSYQPIHFSPAISGQLLTIIQAFKGWIPAHYKDKVYDSYQYITLRLRNGKIISISP